MHSYSHINYYESVNQLTTMDFQSSTPPHSPPLPPTVNPDGSVVQETPSISFSTNKTDGVMHPPDNQLTSGQIPTANQEFNQNSKRSLPSVDSTVQTSTFSSQAHQDIPAVASSTIAKAPVIPSSAYQPVSAPNSQGNVPGSQSNFSSVNTSSSNSVDNGNTQVVQSGYKRMNNNDYRNLQKTIADYAQNSNGTLYIRVYTDKSFLVCGDTQTYKDKLNRNGFGGSWISRPRDNGEKGWCFPNTKFEEVRSYVEGVNTGSIEAPPPTAPTQRIGFDIYKPTVNSKVKVIVGDSSWIYIISNVSNGYPIGKATVVAEVDPNNIQEMVIMWNERGFEWQIQNFTPTHRIEPIVETTVPVNNFNNAGQYHQMAMQMNRQDNN